jgi:hypothetical protein
MYNTIKKMNYLKQFKQYITNQEALEIVILFILPFYF